MEFTAAEDNSSKRSTPPWQGKESDSNKDPKVERCGIGFWHPSCLEPFRDIRAFIAAMCFVSCLQASYSGYTSSQITTLEKRFAISSIVIGAVNSFFEVGYISCVMIVSYLGAKGRVPLWIGCGLFAMSCGAFLFSTPHFLFPYDSSLSSSSREYLCSADSENQNFSVNSHCTTRDHGSYHFLPILLFAQFLIGAGSSPILTLAPPFVDDHVSSSKAPAMIASLYAAAALGPVFGYALGALMLQYPVDKWSKEKIISSHLTPASEDWIGLWWAGYIVLGLGVLLGTCILIMFPRTLRSTFASNERSLESSDMIPGTSGAGGGATDVTMLDFTAVSSKDGHSVSSSQVMRQTALSHPRRATYQHHQRSFSGNVPFSDASSHGISTTPTSNATFFPSSRPQHQRSASVSSILFHAAVIAATASHAAEEDEALPLTDTCSESSSDSEFSCASPIETDRLSKRQSRLEQTGRESRLRSSMKHRTSLSARQQPQWTSNFWSSRSSSHGVPGSRLSWRPQNTAAVLAVPPPILDVMHEDQQHEDTAAEVPTMSPSVEVAEKPVKEAATGIGSASIDSRRLPPPILKGDSGTSTQQQQHHHLPLDEPSSSASRPSLFVHFHKDRRRRHRKIIRGRIFGFLADWSKDIPRSIFSLLKNKIYVVACLCICSEMFIVIGFAGFLPKYMEIEYQISKATASMVAGGLIIPSGAIGILAGGLILNKARWGRKGAVLFVFGINFAIVGCMSSFFFLGCKNPKIAGFTVPYPTRPFANPTGLATAADVSLANASLTSIIKRPWDVECCSSCGCNPNIWKPVCHAKTNTIFFSPCYAGCTKGPTFLPGSNQYVYHNCCCLRNFTNGPERGNNAASLRGLPDASTSTAHIFDDEVFSGTCAPGCKMLIPFICFLTALLFLTGVIQNPLIMVTMRSVRHSQRSLALGLQFVIIRLFAYMPSPIVFGRAIDGACLLWKNECGRRGDCAFMDLKQLTKYITGLGVIVKGSGLLVYTVLIYLLSRRDSRSTVGSNADEELAVTVNLHEDDGAPKKTPRSREEEA
ncbi:hypothetical protein Aperf_G00000072922 [Anoplocephala perfoliata]